MAEYTEKCLLIFLGVPLRLAWTEVSEHPPTRFVYKREIYEAQGDDDFNGFYDWLRNFHNSIIGVRYFPFENFEFLVTLVKKLPYCEVGTNSKQAVWIDIYFSSDRNVDEEISDDQDFGYDWLFKSDLGNYAISLVISEEELLKKIEKLQS